MLQLLSEFEGTLVRNGRRMDADVGSGISIRVYRLLDEAPFGMLTGAGRPEHTEGRGKIKRQKPFCSRMQSQIYTALLTSNEQKHRELRSNLAMAMSMATGLKILRPPAR